MLSLRAGRKIPPRSAAALLSVILFAGLASAQDFQSWNEVDFTAAWKKIAFLVPALARTDPSLPNPQFAASGVVASAPLAKNLRIAGGYLFADLPQSSAVAHVPLIALAATLRKGRLSVLDQSRFEKLFGYGSEPVRYRNLILGDVRFDHDRSHVFVDDEIFFNLSNATWSQNRFQAGAGRRLNPRLSFDAYYLLRSSSAGTSPTHVFGTVLTVGLTRSPA